MAARLIESAPHDVRIFRVFSKRRGIINLDFSFRKRGLLLEVSVASIRQFKFIPPGSDNSTCELSVWLDFSFIYRFVSGLCRRHSRIAILRDTIVGAYQIGLGARTRSDRPVVFRASNCRSREAWEVLQVPRLRGVMAITRAADTASCQPFGALRPLGSFRRSFGVARRRLSCTESRRRTVREMNSQMNFSDLA